MVHRTLDDDRVQRQGAGDALATRQRFGVESLLRIADEPGRHRVSERSPRWPAFPLSRRQGQADAERRLARLSLPTEGDDYGALPQLRADRLWVRGTYRGPDPGAQVPLAAGQATPGALNATYDVPDVRFKRSAISFLVASATLFVSWLDRPYKVTPRQQQQLDSLFVAVVVPVYNEDPELLDRCLWSLVNSTRPPDEIYVVEDGPSGNYAQLREHWLTVPGVRWTQLTKNRGKKHAQSAAFMSCPEADIFITVDSDTTLAPNAIDEGLKPFANPRIASVAGIEEIYNKRANWLTMSCAVRNSVYQLIAWSTQSVF